MLCSTCNGEIADETGACPHCGTAVAPVVEAQEAPAPRKSMLRGIVVPGAVLYFGYMGYQALGQGAHVTAIFFLLTAAMVLFVGNLWRVRAILGISEGRTATALFSVGAVIFLVLGAVVAPRT